MKLGFNKYITLTEPFFEENPFYAQHDVNGIILGTKSTLLNFRQIYALDVFEIVPDEKH